MTTPADVMVIFAHPDDAEFGAAGTIAKWIKTGRRIIYVACTSGEKGTTDPELSPEHLAEIRENEQQTAASLLGVAETLFLRHPDQGLEDTPGFRKEIVRLLRAYRPKIVVTSDPYKRYIWHRDHRILGQVVLDAVFPFARDHLAYPDMLDQGLLPHKVKEILFWGAEDINYYIDITENFDLKLAALCCHKSQAKEWKFSNTEKWLRQWCTEMTQGSDFDLAEAFHRIKTPE
jgi:LmbE family N-acetylglucosaminyl deacetylase